MARWWDNPEEEEANALLVLREVHLEKELVVRFQRVAATLGIPLSWRVSSLCHGSLDRVPTALHVRRRGPDATVQLYGHHELAHLAQSWGGEPYPHREPATTRTAVRVWLPGEPLLREWRALGKRSEALPTIYAPMGVPAPWVLQRLAWARKRQLVFSFARRSSVLVTHPDPPPDVQARVQELARWVRERGEAAQDGRIEAVPYLAEGPEGVAVFLPGTDWDAE